MFTTRIAAAAVGAFIAASAFTIPSASAVAARAAGDRCYVEKVVSQEEIVGTRTVAQPAARQGDWPIGDVKGPQGWTFDHAGTTGGQGRDGGPVIAHVPADTPVGEYTAVVHHFGYSKNQVSEPVTFTVVEEDITESRTWTDREEVPCEDDTHDQGAFDDDSHDAGSGASGTSAQQADFVDHKVLAQQQALNAPVAPAAPAPATAEVTPAPTAQQTQLAENGITGTLTALAVGLLAAAAGAGLLLRRRSR